jgi:hypothetical protein
VWMKVVIGGFAGESGGGCGRLLSVTGPSAV